MPVTFAAMLAVPAVLAFVAGTVLVWQGVGARDVARRDATIVHSEHQVSAAITALRAERAAVAGARRPGQARAEVDSAVGRLGSILAAPDGRVGEVASGQLSRLAEVRAMVDPAAMTSRYSVITGALLDLDASFVAELSDARLAARLTAAHALSRACEYLARQQDLLDLGSAKGGLDGAELSQASEAAVLAANWPGEFTAAAPGEDPAGYSAGKLAEVAARFADSADAAASATVDEATAALRNLVIVLVAAALVAGVVITVVLRHLRRSARSLRTAALDIAGNELPETLSAIRAGRAADGEGPRLPAFTNAEMAEVAAAFESVCDRAAGAVAEQVRLRALHAEVFTGMARRAQSLVRHQLRLAEDFERDGLPVPQPRRFGRLAARLRRTIENVLVLAGTELVRERAEPVPLGEVFAAALSEIEQYQRVEVFDLPDAAIAGAEARDLIRILAELLDNATSFSPAEHDVLVQAQILRDGALSIALIDNGIGMSDEEVLGMNERLMNPGSLEPARSARVGLLVVGRLAERNGFGVELLGGDASPGVTAVVSVPSGLVLGSRAVLAAGAGRR
ncbi:sensor histidine kinase [Amycolatopsis pigmentata]|uniref:histidine kinase n=1 Tax=Amycolatopsis pigmentata TaxID=450801 RepID=A0ABW5G3N7_9PSEU